MKFRAIVEVRLRKDHLDPESETVKKALFDLNFQVSQVKTARIYEIVLEAGSKKDAEAVAKTMCSRLLVIPTRDDYKLEVEPFGSTAKP